jgi:hypothetical protein
LKKGNDMSKTATIYHRDGREKTVDVHEASRLVGAGTVGAGRDWSFVKPPPPGWEREIPKYRATRALHPAPKERFRHEPPFAMTVDSDAWQYATRAIDAGEIVETKDWPHPSFHPLNYGAVKVLEFFNTRQKSRLAQSPWQGDGLRLDDGLSGPVTYKPIHVKPMDLRPAS